jgi:phosphoribosylformylglycinamidine (FGAM) synthase PurS component
MWNERWHTQELELKGWQVKLISRRTNNSYLSEVVSIASGDTIALAIAATREEAQKEALGSAARRLFRNRRFDPELMVGG